MPTCRELAALSGEDEVCTQSEAKGLNMAYIWALGM
jgi:hypothetical protein